MTVVNYLMCCRPDGIGTVLIVNYLMCCRPDGIGTVLQAERVKFDEIKERLRILLENQITHFR